MKKYTRAAATFFIVFLFISGGTYCAISFSALSINPAIWTSEQRDLFSFLGIVIAGVLGAAGFAASIMGYDIEQREKSK